MTNIVRAFAGSVSNIDGIPTDSLYMLFKIQHWIVDFTPNFVQPNYQCTRGSQRLHQIQATKNVYISILSLHHQRLESAANICHQPPGSSGIQGKPSQAASLTICLLDSQQPVLSFNWWGWGRGCFYPVLLDIAIFQQGKQQSDKDFYPYTGRIE